MSTSVRVCIPIRVGIPILSRTRIRMCVGACVRRHSRSWTTVRIHIRICIRVCIRVIVIICSRNRVRVRVCVRGCISVSVCV